MVENQLYLKYNKIMRTMNEKDIIYNPYTRLNLPSPCMGEHCHTFFEFNIIENGICLQSVNNGPMIECSKGEVHLIRPYEVHNIEFLTRNSIWRDIYIKEDVLKKICFLFGNDFYQKFISLKGPLTYKLTSEEFNVFQKKISRLSQMLLNQEEYITEIEVIYQSIVMDIVEKIIEKDVMIKTNAPEWLNDLYLRLTYYDFVELTIPEIIQKTGFSQGYVSSLFKKYYGETIISYHNKMKIMYSVNMLGKMKIIEIANNLGWENPKNYSIEFKRIYGVSPKTYELMLRKHL